MAAIGRIPKGATGRLECERDDGRQFTHPTFTCAHCQHVHEIMIGAPMDWGYCRRCMAPVCPNPACNDHCDPFEKKLERSEARGRLLRDMGIT